MVAADAQRVAVAGDDPHVEIGIGEFHPRRHRRRAAVDRVEAVSLHIIRKTRRAADARDEHRLGRIGADLGQRPLDGLEDRVIAAPWAPRSEEHTSELQSLMRISYAVFCLKKKKKVQYTSA